MPPKCSINRTILSPIESFQCIPKCIHPAAERRWVPAFAGTSAVQEPRVGMSDFPGDVSVANEACPGLATEGARSGGRDLVSFRRQTKMPRKYAAKGRWVPAFAGTSVVQEPRVGKSDFPGDVSVANEARDLVSFHRQTKMPRKYAAKKTLGSCLRRNSGVVASFRRQTRCCRSSRQKTLGSCLRRNSGVVASFRRQTKMPRKYAA